MAVNGNRETFHLQPSTLYKVALAARVVLSFKFER